ncbi:hypothetical protein [Paenisporosarcina sp. OV554]|uniref:hypothetical protein n=1 Tax=Paenisporosarcina sp. OV554 TaxID=2135694 RepID=UPI000D36F753|nr:hypothetical protein [Paenisporosarcina sp. OV554]PUB17865.1 hypothetical protein C8K15_10159 [Paenisporosarcina sp. OV554]
MPVTDWFIIRTLTIPSSWVAVLLAILLTGIIVWRKFGKETEDWFSGAAILFLLVWKFSVVITDFEMIIDSPFSILYFNGGSVGVILGLSIALSKLLLQFKRENWQEFELVAMLFSMVMLQSLYQIIMVLLNEASPWQKIVTVVLFVLLATLTWLKITSSTTWQFQLIVLFLLTHIFVALIQPQGVLQTPLIVTGIFVVCGLLAHALTNKQHEFTEE